jgi:hypothetical protein
MPHGRSWKILNRELFSNFALPRYFGHSNHASFVRIVNAWGFRRITKGPDRDSYYHELFLRGKPRLHERMKRLPTCHRKTPVDKDDKCPDFYELAKTSPLPEVSWSLQGSGSGIAAANASAAARANAINQANAMNAANVGYGNPMAATSMGMGMGMNANIYGNTGSSNSSAMSNDIPSLLKLLRTQNAMQQQPQQQQQMGGNTSQDIMQQFLRMQQQQQQRNSASPSQSNAAGSTLGQFANYQPVSTTSSSGNTNAMLNTFSGMNNVGQQQSRLSNDKISVNDVVQLRSIERTNELLAQKLALMQQDTSMMMMQQQNPGAPNAGATMPIKTEGGLGSSPAAMNNGKVGGAPSKEEMLLQMIRRENQRNPSMAGTSTSNVPAKVEDATGNTNQGLNHFLKNLNGMQQN